MKLNNKVSIITGASSGIGKSVAERFSEEGAIVIIADLPTTSGEEVAENIRNKGGKAYFIPTDVTQKNEIDSLVEETIKRFKKIDILHNNAGIAMPITPLEQVNESHYNKIMDVNMKGVFFGTQAVIPYMKEAGEGVILCTGSTSAIRPRSGLNVYTASKGAVLAFAKSMALELAPYGIRINCINPVVTDTGMVDDEQREKFIKTIPLGKLAQPLDMANAALFLVSEEASMITGIDIEIDGGRCV